MCWGRKSTSLESKTIWLLAVMKSINKDQSLEVLRVFTRRGSKLYHRVSVKGAVVSFPDSFAHVVLEK